MDQKNTSEFDENFVKKTAMQIVVEEIILKLMLKNLKNYMNVSWSSIFKKRKKIGKVQKLVAQVTREALFRFNSELL